MTGRKNTSGTAKGGSGRGSGQGRGQGQGGGGRGGGFGMGGPGGKCICPQCAAEVEHKRGIPCREIACPKCGSFMVRG